MQVGIDNHGVEVDLTVDADASYLRCDIRLFLHQYLSSSRYSILSSDSELRCGVTSSLALLKTRSTSADIAGIDSRSKACC